MSYREEKFVKEFNLDLDGMGGFGTAHGGKEPADVEQIIGIDLAKDPKLAVKIGVIPEGY